MIDKKENLNVDQVLKNNGRLINVKISIGIIVGLMLLFFAALFDRTFLFDGFYWGAILLMALAFNSIIGVAVNILKWKVRKNPYRLLFFHTVILIASILALVIGFIAVEGIKMVLLLIFELIREAIIELLQE